MANENQNLDQNKNLSLGEADENAADELDLLDDDWDRDRDGSQNNQQNQQTQQPDQTQAQETPQQETPEEGPNPEGEGEPGLGEDASKQKGKGREEPEGGEPGFGQDASKPTKNAKGEAEKAGKKGAEDVGKKEAGELGKKGAEQAAKKKAEQELAKKAAAQGARSVLAPIAGPVLIVIAIIICVIVVVLILAAIAYSVPKDEKAIDCSPIGEVPCFFQNDPKWANVGWGTYGSMATSACGLTSMAMALSGWVGEEITPPKLAQKIGSDLAGHSVDQCHSSAGGLDWGCIPDIPTLYGLPKAEVVNWTRAKEYLQKGTPVLSTWPAGSAWTDGGHFVLLANMNSNGQVNVHDPYNPSKITGRTAPFCNKYIEESKVNNATQYWVIKGKAGSTMSVHLPEECTAADDAASGDWTWPVKGKFSLSDGSDFGWRMHPVLGVRKFHTGVDLPAGMGDPIYSFGPGKVIYKGEISGYGYSVVVAHEKTYNGHKVWSHYAHLQSFKSKVGDVVTSADIVAAADSTGMSTGSHLHFNVMKQETVMGCTGESCRTYYWDPELFRPKFRE
jgi:hypothetical protein